MHCAKAVESSDQESAMDVRKQSLQNDVLIWMSAEGLEKQRPTFSATNPYKYYDFHWVYSALGLLWFQYEQAVLF